MPSVGDVIVAVAPLTGWTALAMVRTNPQRHLILDLAPVITNATGGEITISLTDEETAAIETPGDYVWDLVLERPSGERLGPFIAGNFIITTANTRV